MKMKAARRCKCLKVWKRRFNERGLFVGSFLTSRFVDPTVIPEVEESPALVKRGGKRLMPECCESMTKKEELDEQLFDDLSLIHI